MLVLTTLIVKTGFQEEADDDLLCSHQCTLGSLDWPQIYWAHVKRIRIMLSHQKKVTLSHQKGRIMFSHNDISKNNFFALCMDIQKKLNVFKSRIQYWKSWPFFAN